MYKSKQHQWVHGFYGIYLFIKSKILPIIIMLVLRTILNTSYFPRLSRRGDNISTPSGFSRMPVDFLTDFWLVIDSALLTKPYYYQL